MMFRLLACGLLLIVCGASNAEDRYKVEYFDSYLVGLYAVTDNKYDHKTGWDRVVSRPYVYGAVPELRLLVDEWNKRGKRPHDEDELCQKLAGKGIFTFPPKPDAIPFDKAQLANVKGHLEKMIESWQGQSASHDDDTREVIARFIEQCEELVRIIDGV